MSTRWFSIKRGDLLPVIEATLRYADGEVIDLTGATVRLVMSTSRSAAPKVAAAGVVVDAPGGVVQYVWAAGDTDTAGRYIAEWEVTSGGKTLTVPNDSYFEVVVTGDLPSSGTPSTPTTEAYTDAALAAHVDAADPHPQYLLIADAGDADPTLGGDLEGTASAAVIADGAVTPAKLSFDPANQAELDAAVVAAAYPRRSYDGDEPGAYVAWTADDGYTTQVDYFALLEDRGLTGTLFLTVNWVDGVGVNGTWSDTYITTAQVEALVDAGHELGSHGINHESFTSYLTTNGTAATAAFFDTQVDYLEDTFGVTVHSGAYPAGASDRRVREIASRRHRYYRGTKGLVSEYANDPFDVPAIDIQSLSEAAIRAHVDTAVASRSMVVFLLHGGLTGPNLTTYGNVMDYVTSLGVAQGGFTEGLEARTVIAQPGYQRDSSGNIAARTVRAKRLEMTRDDTTGGYWYADVDESTNAPYFDSLGNTPFEFRKQVAFSDFVTFAATPTFNAAVQMKATENILHPTSFVSDTEFLLRVRRSAAAPSDASADLLRMDHRGYVYLRGPQARIRVETVAGVERLALTNAGTIRMWDAGTSTIKTGTLTGGVLSWA